MRTFLDEEEINRFSITGFSLGARLAGLTMELFGRYIERLILIAPDGITTNFYYDAATRFSIPRSYFRYIIRHPNSFFRLLWVARLLGIIDEGTGRFVSRQMRSEEDRKRVYTVWMLYRDIRISNENVAGLINRMGIPTKIFTGVLDKIIGRREIMPLVNLLQDAELIELPVGHTRLVEKTAYWLAAESE
jgi:pimeloyl-ACP methyl ester carboxylesterase